MYNHRLHQHKSTSTLKYSYLCRPCVSSAFCPLPAVHFPCLPFRRPSLAMFLELRSTLENYLPERPCLKVQVTSIALSLCLIMNVSRIFVGCWSPWVTSGIAVRLVVPTQLIDVGSLLIGPLWPSYSFNHFGVVFKHCKRILPRTLQLRRLALLLTSVVELRNFSTELQAPGTWWCTSSSRSSTRRTWLEVSFRRSILKSIFFCR